MEVKDIFNEMNFDNRIELEEMPELDLYMDQVIQLFENKLSSLKRNDEEKILTKTMINNYVKHNIINPPVNKKYNKEHMAYLFVIFILKQIYSIDEIKKMLDLAIKTSPIDQSYNRFCSELEKAIKMTFTGENYINNNRLSKEQYLLRNAVQSFANKLYVQKVFLERD